MAPVCLAGGLQRSMIVHIGNCLPTATPNPAELNGEAGAGVPLQQQGSFSRLATHSRAIHVASVTREIIFD